MRFPDLLKFPEFAYDTETTGLNPMAGARVFGFSISTPDGKDYYWDIRETPAAVEWFNAQVEAYTGTIICHNLSFDYRQSHATGIFLPLEQCVDTVIQACLINEHEFSYSLDALCKKYTTARKSGQELYEAMAKIFGGRATRNVQMKRISEAPIHLVAPYAMDDTRGTLELYYYQMGQIKYQKLEKIVEFERSLTPKIIAAEMHGVRVDIPKAEQAVSALSEQIKLAQKGLDEVAGFACNPQPGKSMKQLFGPKWRDGRWFASDGTPLTETKAGAASLGADALRTMTHPAASRVLELRSLIKTRDTFLVGHVLESAAGGRVYPSVNQTKGEDGGTGTGRLSYSGPALQQIPDRNKVVAEIVKQVFLPDEGHVWIDADLKSFEVNIFAHLVGTNDILDVYRNDPETDFHQFVADLAGMVRNATYNGQPNAKQLNLSMIFNQGNGTTAEQMGMPWDWESFIPKDSKDGKEVIYKKAGPEAMAIIEKYHQHLPGVKKLAMGCKQTAEQRGWLFTRYGRHLRFPKGYKSYKASGILIQSTSADENKLNWLRIDEALDGTGGKMLLNTHDSYSLSVPEGKSLEIAKKVKEAVERDRGLRVPLTLEVQHPGKNWWESKSSKRWM
jgi:DNA polymerase I-like protein with 3'-5' exonuclease and polymerase domains